MSGDLARQGILDTNIMILRRWIDPGQLPDEMAISAITLAELSARAHEVRRNSDQDMYDDDFTGLDNLLRVITVTRPNVPHELRPRR